MFHNSHPDRMFSTDVLYNSVLTSAPVPTPKAADVFLFFFRPVKAVAEAPLCPMVAMNSERTPYFSPRLLHDTHIRRMQILHHFSLFPTSRTHTHPWKKGLEKPGCGSGPGNDGELGLFLFF